MQETALNNVRAPEVGIAGPCVDRSWASPPADCAGIPGAETTAMPCGRPRLPRLRLSWATGSVLGAVRALRQLFIAMPWTVLSPAFGELSSVGRTGGAVFVRPSAQQPVALPRPL
jgi:hypothetical protein